MRWHFVIMHLTPLYIADEVLLAKIATYGVGDFALSSANHTIMQCGTYSKLVSLYNTVYNIQCYCMQYAQYYDN